MAYVSVSRAQYDVQMYTNDAKTLGQELSRDVSHPTALQSQTPIQQTTQPTGMQQQTPTQPDTAQKIEQPQQVGMELSQGMSLSR